MSGTGKNDPIGRSKFPLKGKVPSGKENACPSRPKKLAFADREQKCETVSRRRFSLTTDESAGSNHTAETVGLSNGFLAKQTPFHVHCDQRNSRDVKRKISVQRRGPKQGTSRLETIKARSRDGETKVSLQRSSRITRSPSVVKGPQPRSQIPLPVDVKECQRKTSYRSKSVTKTNQDIQNGDSCTNLPNASVVTGARSASVSRLPVPLFRPLRRSLSDDTTITAKSKPLLARPRPIDRYTKKPDGSFYRKPAPTLKKNSVTTRSMASLFNDKSSVPSTTWQSYNNLVYEKPKVGSRKLSFPKQSNTVVVKRPKISWTNYKVADNNICGNSSNVSSPERPSKMVKEDTPAVDISFLKVKDNRQDSGNPESEVSAGSQGVQTPVQSLVPIPVVVARKSSRNVSNENEMQIIRQSHSKEDNHELFAFELVNHTEYHESLPIVEFEKEQLSPRLSDNFLQKDVNAEQRNLVVNFLIHLSVHCHYPCFVTYQTVKLFDILIDSLAVDTIHIQLMALATLWIVLKRQINIKRVPSSTTMIALAKELYVSREDLLIKFERTILKTLKFNTSVADPFSLLTHHLINCQRHLHLSEEQKTAIYNCGSYVIDLSLLDEQFCRTSTSLIAFTTAELALGVLLGTMNDKTRPRWTFWRVFLKGASPQCNRFQDGEINALRIALLRRVLSSDGKYSVSKAVYKKYKRRRYGRISDGFLKRVKNLSFNELLDF